MEDQIHRTLSVPFFPCRLLPTGEPLLRPRLPASLHLPDLLLAAPAAKDRDGIVPNHSTSENCFRLNLFCAGGAEEVQSQSQFKLQPRLPCRRGSTRQY